MEAKDLRIGNYINSLGQKFDNENQFKGWDNNVVEVNIDVLKNIFIENKDFKYSPIPLTEEWMGKFGFKLFPWGFVLNGLRLNYNLIPLTFRYMSDNGSIEFEYVHQLQNLYFALTGEELEINL